jgi:MtN3 and saliva related transmembrane protein
MDSGVVESIGSIAGLLTTGAYLPQVIKTWRTRSTDDLSLLMFAVLCTGVALWIVYGVFVAAWPLVIANVVTLALSGIVLVLKLLGGSRGTKRGA